MVRAGKRLRGKKSRVEACESIFKESCCSYGICLHRMCLLLFVVCLALGKQSGKARACLASALIPQHSFRFGRHPARGADVEIIVGPVAFVVT